MATGGFTEQGSRRSVFLEPGPVAVCAAEYALDSGEVVRVPLTLPLGPPAEGGRIVVTLPGPAQGGFVQRVDLLAEDGVAIFRLYPAVCIAPGDTLSLELDASSLPL